MLCMDQMNFDVIQCSISDCARMIGQLGWLWCLFVHCIYLPKHVLDIISLLFVRWHDMMRLEHSLNNLSSDVLKKVDN